MKISKILFLSFSVALLCSTAQAQQFGALEADVEALKEDVRALQRNAYRAQNDDFYGPVSSSDMAVRVGEMDENMRKINGRLDEIEYKLKTMNERIDMINRDIDVRISMIEGKPIKSSGLGVQEPKEKFAPKVADNAPKSLLGAEIDKGTDLPSMPTKTADQIYKEGLEYLKAKNYDKAEGAFDSVLRRFPQDKLAGNAQFWLGEVYYSRGQYKEAAVAFGKVYKNYKDGPKGADGLLKLGMSMKELNNKEAACEAFVNMKSEFPKAEDRIKNKAAEEAKKLGCK